MDATLYPWETQLPDGLIVIDYELMRRTLAEWEAQLERLDQVEGFELTPAACIDLLTPDAE